MQEVVDALAVVLATSNGSNNALALLCGLLRRRGLLTAEDVEALMHLALREFDEMLSANQPRAEKLAVQRAAIEKIWQQFAIDPQPGLAKRL